MRQIKAAVKVLNVPAWVCKHALGHDHTPRHRMAAGSIVMTVGVLVAHSTAALPFHILVTIGDVVGFTIHAVGATPFIEWLISRTEKNDDGS